MTALYLAAEWQASFIEACLCLFLMHLFFADQFARRKQRWLPGELDYCFFQIPAALPQKQH